MNGLLGIVNNTKEGRELNSIIKKRSLSTVPFGGRYRIIDFHLSNMVNSGIFNIGIMVKKNYRSLMGHIRSPKEWGLDLKKDGIFVLPPDNEGREWGSLRGDLEILEANRDYLKRSSQEYVVMVNANMICNIDYKSALDHHRDMKNDITVIYKKVREDELCRVQDFTQVKLDEDEKVKSIEGGGDVLKADAISMEMYIMKKSLLEEIMDSCIARGEYDFLKDGIINKSYKYKMGGFEYTGEFMNIYSVNSYYRNSMNLLKKEIREDIFMGRGTIYTTVKDSPPTKYGCGASVKNSLIANGAIIDGVVENSIIFRDVKVAKGVTIKDSIIMQGTSIEEGVELESVIIDKDCRINSKTKLVGSPDYPVLIEKNTSI